MFGNTYDYHNRYISIIGFKIIYRTVTNPHKHIYCVRWLFNIKNINTRKIMAQKVKCIEITTTEPLGFQEMSDMFLQIEKLTKKYQANYKIKYSFKNSKKS